MSNKDRSLKEYHLNHQDTFIVEDYNRMPPFSSFFPGISGVFGIPMWVFYVNRGQGIASFGIKDKDNPILEFHPANKAYQNTTSLGFRTFMKVLRRGKELFYEPFIREHKASIFKISNAMEIRPYELCFRERNFDLGIETTVKYFTVPNEAFSGLVRMLEVRNVSRNDLSFSICDGLPQIIPFGINNFFLKEMHRTIEAWMRVDNLQNRMPYIRLSVDPTDSSEVIHLQGGNFFMSSAEPGELLKVVVDPRMVFGNNSDFSFPGVFAAKGFEYSDEQLTQSITPSAFSLWDAKVKAGGSSRMTSLFGNMRDITMLKRARKLLTDPKYILEKEKENAGIIKKVAHSCFTASDSKNFDLYVGQTFLDNCLRGGFPHTIKADGIESVLYVYSRKHGDLERDYNKFVLNPTFFSEGNGNFRDVNQNRRMDCMINPKTQDLNVKMFFNLQQMDGYNPLVVKGSRFAFSQEKNSAAALFEFFSPADAQKVSALLKKHFKLGELLTSLCDAGVRFKQGFEPFVKFLILNSERMEEADFGEGYWSDHWEYNIDLLENYLAVFPERQEEILLLDKSFTFFDSEEFVKPRKERYVLTGGTVRQYRSLKKDPQKLALVKSRSLNQHCLRVNFGQGDVYRTTLMVKLLVLVLNKLASLDPAGVGIEMEANKPNWFDALNGLPALFGSSVCETFELKRTIKLMIAFLSSPSVRGHGAVTMPQEVGGFFDDMRRIVGEYPGSDSARRDFIYWDSSNDAKERFRAQTSFGIDGKETQRTLDDLTSFLDSALRRIDSSIGRAWDKKSGAYNSYFINELVKFETAGQEVKPLEFRQRALPLFLEGNVHAMKLLEKGDVKRLYGAVRKSALYDRKLKMYKVNVSLKGESEDIGRCTVFTPGWLENESIWLHMEYKYLLELLKAGLYEEYYKEFGAVMVCFLNPRVYSRSILENSSFIVSSAFPDRSFHGRGFVARLSGSSAELINMWMIMCSGMRPFYLDDHASLILELKPLLKGKMFLSAAKQCEVSIGGKELVLELKRGDFAFNFLGRTLVVYHNPQRRDTFGKKGTEVASVVFSDKEAKQQVVYGCRIPQPFSGQIRDGAIERIDVFLK